MLSSGIFKKFAVFRNHLICEATYFTKRRLLMQFTKNGAGKFLLRKRFQIYKLKSPKIGLNRVP